MDFTILIFSLLIPKVGLSKDKSESKSIDDASYYTAPDELAYFYNLYDRDLMNSKELFELDRMVNNISTNSKKIRL